MVLPGHRPEPAHLPERPLDRVVTAVNIGGKELAGLLGEIQQHRAGFEDRDRLAAALRLVIDQPRNPVVRRDRQKLRLELISFADVDRENFVLQPGLFEKHRDLVAVRRGPVIEIDHGAFFPAAAAADACHPNWMRLHEAHRIMPAKSMAGVSHPGELSGAYLHDRVSTRSWRAEAGVDAGLPGHGQLARINWRDRVNWRDRACARAFRRLP